MGPAGGMLLNPPLGQRTPGVAHGATINLLLLEQVDLWLLHVNNYITLFPVYVALGCIFLALFVPPIHFKYTCCQFFDLFFKCGYFQVLSRI